MAQVDKTAVDTYRYLNSDQYTEKTQGVIFQTAVDNPRGAINPHQPGSDFWGFCCYSYRLITGTITGEILNLVGGGSKQRWFLISHINIYRAIPLDGIAAQVIGRTAES